MQRQTGPRKLHTSEADEYEFPLLKKILVEGRNSKKISGSRPQGGGRVVYLNEEEKKVMPPSGTLRGTVSQKKKAVWSPS